MPHVLSRTSVWICVFQVCWTYAAPQWLLVSPHIIEAGMDPYYVGTFENHKHAQGQLPHRTLELVW